MGTTLRKAVLGTGSSRDRRMLLFAIGMFAAAFLLLAPRAQADETLGAELTGATPGMSITVLPPGGGAPVSAYAALVQVELEDGRTADAFCIQRYIPTAPGNTYVTAPWSDQTTALGSTSIGPIRWILDHSPPQTPIADLEAAVGVTLTPNQAYAAIQAAIWNFSDGVTLDLTPGTNPAEVVDTYNYLVAQATANAAYTPADPAIGLTAPAVPGEAGGLVGPFTINAAPGTLSVDASLAPGSPAGIAITNASGQPISGPFSNGQQLYLSIPEGQPAGSAEIVVSARANRRDLVLLPDSPASSQRLLLATTLEARIDAKAMGMWVAKRATTDKGGENGDRRKIQRKARLSIAKRADRRTVTAGGNVRYRITVRNRGNAAARNVRVCDRLAANVTVVSRGGGSLSGNQVCWRIRGLGRGKSVTRSIVVRVDRDTAGGRLINRATVQMAGKQAGSARAAVRVLRAERKAVAEDLVTG